MLKLVKEGPLSKLLPKQLCIYFELFLMKSEITLSNSCMDELSEQTHLLFV